MNLLIAYLLLAVAAAVTHGQITAPNCTVDVNNPQQFFPSSTPGRVVVPGSAPPSQDSATADSCPSETELVNLRLPTHHVVRIMPPANQAISITITCRALIDAAGLPCEASCGTVIVSTKGCYNLCNVDEPGLLPYCVDVNFQGSPFVSRNVDNILIPAYQVQNGPIFVNFIRNQRAGFSATVNWAVATANQLACPAVALPVAENIPFNTPIRYDSDASANSCSLPGFEYIESITSYRPTNGFAVNVGIITEAIFQGDGKTPCSGSQLGGGWAIGVNSCIRCADRFNPDVCTGGSVCSGTGALGTTTTALTTAVLGQNPTIFITLCYRPNQVIKQAFTLELILPPSPTPTPSATPSTSFSPTPLPLVPNVECLVPGSVSGLAPLAQTVFYIPNNGVENGIITCWPSVSDKKRQAVHPLRICVGQLPIGTGTVQCTDPQSEPRPVGISISFQGGTAVPYFSIQSTTVVTPFICRVDCSSAAGEILPVVPYSPIPGAKVDLPPPRAVTTGFDGNYGFSYTAYADNGQSDGLISPDIFSSSNMLTASAMITALVTMAALLF